MKRQAILQRATGAVLAMYGAVSCAAQTPNYAIIYSFKGGTDAATPHGSVTIGKNGILFGTTLAGGTNSCGSSNCGTVFALTPSTQRPWPESVIHSFDGGDGQAPNAGVTLTSSGALFGTTETGGPSGGGTVFELTPPTAQGGSWTESTLYGFTNFGSNNENTPNTLYGGVLVGAGGTIYGTTYNSHISNNGKTGGTVFTLTPPETPGDSWTETTLVDFWTAGIGFTPFPGVVASGGSLYGTTYFSNSNDVGGCGSVYELTPPTSGGAWTAIEAYGFKGTPDGCNPVAPLTVGPGGVLYGTTLADGSGTCYFVDEGCGTVFELIPPSSSGGPWTENVIYNFTATNGDGAWPYAGVVLGKNGILYGTTQAGGSATAGSPCSRFGVSGCGTVYQLTPPSTPGGVWTETVLHSFSGKGGDGAVPWSTPVIAPSGALYGTTGSGGAYGYGTVYEVLP